MTEKSKRGANGGIARAAKLSKEKLSAIATAAAKKRWSKDKEESQPTTGASAIVTIVDDVTPVNLTSVGDYSTDPIVTISEAPQETGPKHCPACMNGQSLEEGEGTHILATVEHPVTLPAGFEDGEASVAVQTPPAPPQKPAKRQVKPMPKEFKSAGSYAEKRILAANKERAVHVGEIAKHQTKIHELDAEINGLLPIIKALGGTVDMPQAPVYANGAPYQFTPPASTPVPQLPPLYPEYAQPQPVTPDVAPVKPMKAGGAGVAQGMLQVPPHWYEG